MVEDDAVNGKEAERQVRELLDNFNPSSSYSLEILAMQDKVLAEAIYEKGKLHEFLMRYGPTKTRVEEQPLGEKSQLEALCDLAVQYGKINETSLSLSPNGSYSRKYSVGPFSVTLVYPKIPGIEQGFEDYGIKRLFEEFPSERAMIMISE